MVIDGQETGHVSLMYDAECSPVCSLTQFPTFKGHLRRNHSQHCSKCHQHYVQHRRWHWIGRSTYLDWQCIVYVAGRELIQVNISSCDSSLLYTSLSPSFNRTDCYVRVIGSIKNFQGRRSVNSGHIRAVTDFNEIFFHKLDAIHNHLYSTKGAIGGKAVSVKTLVHKSDCDWLSKLMMYLSIFLEWCGCSRWSGRGSKHWWWTESIREATSTHDYEDHSRPSNRGRESRS
jgi:hypothetical protein